MRRILLTIAFAMSIACAAAQRNHAQIYLGGGYGLISGDMYNHGCWEVNLGMKYFITDYVFLDLSGEIGGSKGNKKLTISSSGNYKYHPERGDFKHSLTEYGAFLGPGYNLYNNGQSRLYVKAQAGYTWGREYKEALNDTREIRIYPAQPYRPGFAAVASLGYDWQKAGNSLVYGSKIDVYYIRGHVMTILNVQIGAFF